MRATFYEIAGLIDAAGFAEFHQLGCLLEGYLLLELIATQSIGIRRALNSQISAVVTDTHPNGKTVTTTDITLTDATATESLSLVIIVTNQKLSFYLQSAH